MKSQGSMKEVQWSTYIQEMRAHFYNQEYADPISEPMSLKQTKSLEDYYEGFEALLNLLQLIDEYALSVFISNWKLDISRSMQLFYPKDITHAFNLAKQMEVVLYNLPKKPLIPHKPFYPNQNTTSPAPLYSKLPSNNSLTFTKLPPLLPTPKVNTNPYPYGTKPSYNLPIRTPFTKSET